MNALVFLLLCISIQLYVGGGCIEREREALLDFKISVTSSSNRLSSWFGQDCCIWSGVVCNNLTHVVELNLQRSGIVLHGSEVTQALSELKDLKVLNLGGNDFGGTKIPDFIGGFRSLRELSLSDSSFAGVVPHSLGNLSNLMRLDLGYNKLNGTVPSNLGQLSSLVTLVLSNNLLSGIISEVHFDKLSKLRFLDFSHNFLLINVSSTWIPPFQLYHLLLGSCQLGSKFPPWLLKQKAITWISIPNTLSGPSHLGDLLPHFPSNIEVLKLSSNLISGSIPHNIGDLMPNLRVLILSSNSIEGGISTSLCGMRKLEVVDLSHNNLVGYFPWNCWRGSSNMRNIDLSSNGLTGTIPSGIGQLNVLFSLHLSKNTFYGELPMEMRNCRNLNILDLADNGFSGKIPSWIKELWSLQILKLRSNKFEGSLIYELCQIHTLCVLDLADNNFSGAIPTCFENFDGMKQGGNMQVTRFYGYNEKLEQVIKGRELQYTKTLKYLVNLDLSNNNLAGNIPEGLTSLVGLSAINLSNNGLIGGIPNMIGKLKLLESLDFSRNRLSGTIPQSMSDLGLIGQLNLSFNDLSGQIPLGHLQAFDSSTYKGNIKLCGIPLEKKCSKGKSPEFVDIIENEKHEIFVDDGFYIAMGAGVMAGFWGFYGVLIFRRMWRFTYFKFIEDMHDMFLKEIT